MDRISHDKVDVAIVGAGAAGSYFAARLAEAGKSVVVLEAGPAWEMADLKSSGIWGRRLKGHAGGIERTGTDPWGYAYNSGRGLGGAALHHYAIWPRLAPDDFRVRSQYGRGLDWPISYDELRPWYDRIQRQVGIAGDAEAEIWRGPGDPYPMPPHPVFAAAKVLARGFKALGMRTAPVPLAINSVAYGGRAPCLYEGWCAAGCPVGALANPLSLHIPRARAAGAEFRTGARVTRVAMSGAERASALDYVDAAGKPHHQHADLVILAAFVVENPRLLLNSANEFHPGGIGNGAGLVGRYLMTHPLVYVHGLFAEETEPHLGVSGGLLTSRDGYAKDGRAPVNGGPAPFGSSQWLLAPAQKPNDLEGIATARADLFGKDLDLFLKRAVRHYASLVGFVEELPDPENRITLGGATDAAGLPVARIAHSFSANTKALIWHMRAEGLRLQNAAGAEEAWDQPPVHAHGMGGTIMGKGPEDSVADSYGRVHGTRNLLVAGSGLFPTGGAVNPTYTIYALAARSADHLLDHWSDYAG